jgi:hypothetical protein
LLVLMAGLVVRFAAVGGFYTPWNSKHKRQTKTPALGRGNSGGKPEGDGSV